MLWLVKSHILKLLDLEKWVERMIARRVKPVIYLLLLCWDPAWKTTSIARHLKMVVGGRSFWTTICRWSLSVVQFERRYPYRWNQYKS